jgi:hypothetical protein
MSRPPLNQEPTLTPHFSGFEFLSENDAKWLGLMDAKVCNSCGFGLFLFLVSPALTITLADVGETKERSIDTKKRSE